MVLSYYTYRRTYFELGRIDLIRLQVNQAKPWWITEGTAHLKCERRRRIHLNLTSEAT